ncbi:MAG: hypothetical protein HY094_05560 [Candidatus Melainabacteria bacterium]|nr:hypothetical protein [Candidatus Melainabacteria bacterium]
MPENLVLQKIKKQDQVKEQPALEKAASKKNLLFFFIIIVSFYLRSRGIYNGLPYALNPDESRNLLGILSTIKHLISFNSFESSPLYFYLNALVVFFTSGTIDINNLLNTLEVNPGAFYVPLRLISILFGVGSVIVLYFIGSIFSLLTGLLASGFLAVSLLHVRFSQIFLPFSVMTFFSLLSVLFILKSYLNKNLNLFSSTVCALFSAFTNCIGSLSIIPVLLVQVVKKDFSKFKFLLGSFLLSFLLFNPQLIINFLEFIRYLTTSYINGYYDYRYSSYLLYLFNFLIPGVGPVVWISAFYFFLYRKNDYDLNLLSILFSLPVFYFAVLGLFHLSYSGYAVLLLPYMCLASGMFFNSLSFKRDKKFLFIVLLIFAFYIPLKYVFKYNKIISLSDTRVIATDWVNENAHGDVKIVWDKNSIQTKGFAPYDKNSLKNIGVDPDSLVDKQRFYVSLKLLENKDWFRILRKKVDYVIVNSLDAQMILREPGHKLEKKYYKRLLKLKPFITFNPYLLELEKKVDSSIVEDLYSPLQTLWQRERGGPLINIYKL